MILLLCALALDDTEGQINEAASVIYENVDVDANIIFGALVDPEAIGGFSFPFEPSMMVVRHGFLGGKRHTMELFRNPLKAFSVWVYHDCSIWKRDCCVLVTVCHG